MPIVGLNILVFLSCLTPGLRIFSNENGAFIVPLSVPWWRPSTADVNLSLRALWLFDGLYFSSLNLALFVGRRKVLRVVLAAIIANALALSIFGTVQKLVGSTGLYFNAFKSPQTSFFSSFVYDNHWGAFVLLVTGACIGLVLRASHASPQGEFLKGPGFAGLVATSIIAITVPYSGSRACTALLAVIIAISAARVMPPWIRRARHEGLGSFRKLGFAAAVAALVAVGLWYVAGDVIDARLAKTREQVSEMRAQGGLGSRSILYHDTWAMAKDRRVFGWGMGTFPKVFSLFNSQDSPIDRIPVVYHDAHSDWLQSASEIGVLGTCLLGAAVVLPLASVRRLRIGTIPFYLLTACALVACYAWVEFPFGNVAVVLTWWISFFTAIRYAHLSVGTASTRPPI